MVDKECFYLEKEGKFWEIKRLTDRTIIRAGKIGKTGRKFPEKKHATVYQAKQFARRHVNGKIILGFQEPNVDVPRAPMIKLLSRRSSVRIKHIQPNLSKEKSRFISPLTKSVQQYLISQKNAPNLTKKDTVVISSSSSTNSVKDIKPQWRKPPKKQSTIRRRARQESIVQRANVILGKKSWTKQKSSNHCSLTKKKTEILKDTDSMPRLERRHSSLKNPRLYNPDSSMPKLSQH